MVLCSLSAECFFLFLNWFRIQGVMGALGIGPPEAAQQVSEELQKLQKSF